MAAAYIAASGTGGIWTSSDAGATWTSATNAPPLDFYATAFSADGMKLAAVAYSTPAVFTSTNAGVTWVSNSVPYTRWTSIACSTDGARIAAAAEGAIYTPADSGATWALSFGAAPKAAWQAVACSATGSKLIAGCYYIYTSDDFGASWSQTSAPYAHWKGLACSGDGNIVAAVAEPGLLCISTNAGLMWVTTTVPSLCRSLSVACSVDGTRFVAGTDSISGSAVFISPPQLLAEIAYSNQNMVISWPWTSVPFHLQAATDLKTTNWVDYGTSLENQVTLPRTNGQRFYRLGYP